MNKIYILFLSTFFMFLFACTNVQTKDIQIDAQADPKANFSGYKSYAWLATAAIVNDSFGQWEPPSFDADSEIMHLIDRELRNRGMSEDSVNPDVFVAFAAGIDMDALKLKVSPEAQMKTLENIPMGGLVVALVDSDSGFVIWVGVVTAEVMQSPDAQTVKARLDYAVSKLLKELPK